MRITIGLPVYNGSAFVGEALAALLRETHTDLSIIVSDNASTDETVAICNEFRDSRISIVESPSNQGATSNFNKVARLASSELFVWATADDLFHPDYLQRCHAVLAADPALVGCGAWVEFIDATGKSEGLFTADAAVASATLRRRLRSYLHRPNQYLIFSVFRRPELLRTGLMRDTWGPDVLLLWELLLRHRIHVIPEPLVKYRRYRQKSIAEQMAELRGKRHPRQVRLPSVRMWLQLWQIASTTVKAWERMTAYQELLIALPTEYLFSDVRRALNRGAPTSGSHMRTAFVLVRTPLLLILLALLNPARFAKGVSRFARAERT